MSDEMGLVARLRQSAELFEAVRAMHAGAEGADAEPHWSSQGEAETAHDLASEAAAAIERLVAEVAALKSHNGYPDPELAWDGQPPIFDSVCPCDKCANGRAALRARQALGDT